MKKNKRLVAVLSIILAMTVMMFAGCDGGSDTSGTTPKVTNPAKTPAATEKTLTADEVLLQLYEKLQTADSYRFTLENNYVVYLGDEEGIHYTEVVITKNGKWLMLEYDSDDYTGTDLLNLETMEGYTNYDNIWEKEDLSDILDDIEYEYFEEYTKNLVGVFGSYNSSSKDYKLLQEKYRYVLRDDSDEFTANGFLSCTGAPKSYTLHIEYETETESYFPGENGWINKSLQDTTTCTFKFSDITLQIPGNLPK